MSFFIIIRGPAAVGKTEISRKVSMLLGGYYISYDKLMEKHGMDKIKGRCIPAKNFLAANRIAISKAERRLKSGKPVVFDGCFYHKSQVSHLVKRLPYMHFAFTLKASLKTCIERDSKRKRPIGEKSTRAVYKLVKRFDYGSIIDTEGKSTAKITEIILSRLGK